MMRRQTQSGFTLAEMIMVIVITGIIAGMVAVFITKPVQQYMDLARRAELTDTADTALRRISRDVRLALPNSVRVTGTCNGTTGTCFLEFLPTGSSACATNSSCLGGGRYAVAPPGNPLVFDVADNEFTVLGPMPAIAAGDQIVVYNLGVAGADAYSGNTLATDNRRTVTGTGAGTIQINSTARLPFESPGHRFHVINRPVTYVCAPSATGGTLRRYWGYPINATQPSAVPIANANSALVANNVTLCRFDYSANVVAERSGLVTMQLGLTQDSETVTLYVAVHVSNQP